MHRGGSKARTKREVVIREWRRLGSAPIGKRELDQIQRAIAGRFGKTAVDSPAAIARVLADKGAELRHPEVIEFDARWRETKIESGESAGPDEVVAAKPLTLKEAETLIRKFARMRRKFERPGDHAGLRRLRDSAVSARQAAQSLAKHRKLEPAQRVEQAEIAQWLSVWLQTPDLFDDWLDLRRRSPDFRKKFATEKSS